MTSTRVLLAVDRVGTPVGNKCEIAWSVLAIKASPLEAGEQEPNASLIIIGKGEGEFLFSDAACSRLKLALATLSEELNGQVGLGADPGFPDLEDPADFAEHSVDEQEL